VAETKTRTERHLNVPIVIFGYRDERLRVEIADRVYITTGGQSALILLLIEQGGIYVHFPLALLPNSFKTLKSLKAFCF